LGVMYLTRTEINLPNRYKPHIENDSTRIHMPRIDQFVHTLQYGDAISGEALTIMRLLRESGIESDIYSVHTHEKLTAIPKHISTFEEDTRNQDSAVLLHYSIASPFNDIFSSLSNTKKILVYHNLTPVHWYASYNARVTEDLIKGRDELPLLLQHADMVLADSRFNADEAKALGSTNTEVLPLVLDPHRWQEGPNPGILSALINHGGKNILHVGRLAPNKCIEDIIKGFYFYHHKYQKNSKLWIVGSDTDTEIYSFELRKLAQELRLKEVVEFTGSVSDGELRAFYEGADAYICMSEHEGFCVPVIEALHYEIPIIAFSSSAIPETLGEGGILIEKKDPLLLGTLIHEVITSESEKNALIQAGLRQIETFSLANFKQALNEKLLSHLHLQQKVA
jgi:L-malate glycosyltransferase